MKRENSNKKSVYSFIIIKTMDLLLSNNYPLLDEIKKDFNINSLTDLQNLGINILDFHILKKFEKKRTKKIILQLIEIPFTNCDSKYIKRVFDYNIKNTRHPNLYFIYRKNFYPIEKTYITGRCTLNNALKFINSYISQKTKINRTDDFSNYLLQNFDNYIYVSARKFYTKNEYESENENVDQFIKIITNSNLIKNYIESIKINENFLYEKLDKSFFDTIRKYLFRLEAILEDPLINKKYVFENECDQVIRNILNYKENFSFTDEKIELTLKVCGMLPFEFVPKKEYIRKKELKIIHDKLDELESVNNDFFDREKSVKRNELEKELRCIDTKEHKYTLLNNFFKYNWGSNHLSFKNSVKLINIFEVMYEKEFSSEPLTLLIHGSRLINWKSIIKGGLILPSHPGMFGKGIYFANCFGKSYAYCSDNEKNVVIGMYEVNLGNMLKLSTANNTLTNKTLDSKYNSVWGQGTSSYKEYDLIDNSKLYKTHFRRDKKLSLLHDEFIIYDPSRCRLKYLFFMSRG